MPRESSILRDHVLMKVKMSKVHTEVKISITDVYVTVQNEQHNEKYVFALLPQYIDILSFKSKTEHPHPPQN